MHHLYPSFKGDLLCPLGFHPQTRYPTRCKRCFRDYKEHGGRRGVEDVAASSPNLSDRNNSRPSSRTWTSSQNLSSLNGNNSDIELKKRPQSWTSTPDIDQLDDQTSSPSNNNDVNVTVKLPLQQRRHTTTLDLKEVETSLLLAHSRATSSAKSSSVSSSPSPARNIPDDLVILSTDSLAERVRKMNLLKKQRSQSSRDSSRESSIPRKSEGESSISNNVENNGSIERPERRKSNLLPSTKVSVSSSTSSATSSRLEPITESTTNSHTLPPVPPKSAGKTKNSTSTSTSATPETTLTITRRRESDRQKTPQNERELSEEITSLRAELEAMKSRAERAEREKSDILLRRLASMDTTTNRTAASEALSLQKKVNELRDQLEKVTEEKRKLNVRMKELENAPKSSEYELKRKLRAAEQICEELMEENQEAKKEIMNLQAEMDELQDTFRDDELKAKTSLQKDLDKTTKNCRILSFKLKKCERKIETLEQEKQNSSSEELLAKIKILEEELRFSNELTKQLQAEAEEMRNPGKKKTPTLGVLGKSTSADGKITRESLTRGGSQEDPQQLLRDLQDSVERESDLKDQLKFAEEEAENLRKKVARFEDENDSLMMQLKKMATRSKTRKLSPLSPNRFAAEVPADRDEGISDEDDPAELRILLELNEQEASILRVKVDDLERESSEAKKQVRELQEKLRQLLGEKTNLVGSAASYSAEKRLAIMREELVKLQKSNADKERKIEQLQAACRERPGTGSNGNNNGQQQADVAEEELFVLRAKIATLQSENEKLLKERRQQLRKESSAERSNASAEIAKLKESLAKVEEERNALQEKLKRILKESQEKLPPRTAIRITDLTPKNQLKRWVEELDEEISEMRAIVLYSGAQNVVSLEAAKKALEEELQKCKEKLSSAESEIQKHKSSLNQQQKANELEQQLKKSEEESKKLNAKIKDLEEKLRKQESQIKQSELNRSALEEQAKADKEKLSKLEKNYDKEHKEREKFEAKLSKKDEELSAARKSAEKTRVALEKEVKELKTKSLNTKTDSKQLQDLKKQLEDAQEALAAEKKRYSDLNAHWEKLSEETILMRAQLTTEKANLETELTAAKHKITELESAEGNRTELTKKLSDSQRKIQELEAKLLKSNSSDYERTMLQNKLSEKNQEYDRLRREHEMNVDLVYQLRKDNDELSRKLNDFSRIEQAQSNLNEHSAGLENEIKSLQLKLENSELQLKSEVATTRLRYEQQVKNLSAELTAMQRHCEKFKKDRDAFKQMLESAQRKIGELKANNSGRQSRGSMHSSDEDDKSKIAYLEQQIGSLEDQLVEARLEVSKVKTELVSERSANEIKISEMQSKLNELEEERVIGSGRTKIPAMKTKLELSWQKEREDQQRLLQETSTLARDLRQTLYEVERELDKERLESKRRLEHLKRSTEEEMEEGRKKIAELQCDLLELRDVHAKLRTSNEKLRRERERYEKELAKRRLEQEGGERKLSALLQTVDELVRLAPDLTRSATNGKAARNSNSLQAEPAQVRRSRSPSPARNNSQLAHVLVRIAEASDEIRKYQRPSEGDQERVRVRRGTLRRAASQEDPHGSTSSVASAAGSSRGGSKLSRSSHNGSLIRKSLSLDQSMQQQDQNIWRQEDGSASSMQSIDSELGGMVRDSSYDSRLDSRLSGGSTQSDIPRGPRKKRKGLMGKLRSLTKSSRNSESEVSIQGSDSDISVASDVRASKKDLLRGRLSGMFKRSGSTPRSESTERVVHEQRPVAVTVVGDADGPQPRNPPPADAVSPKPIRSIAKPPTPTTPQTKRRLAK